MTSRAQAVPSSTRAVLELQVNGTRFGDVVVLLSNDDVLVPADALVKAGVVKLRSRRIRYQGIDYYSLRQSDPRLTFQVNEVDLVLDVGVPPSALASATLDLSVPPPPGVWYAEEPSAYLTYAPSLSDFSIFRAFAEAGVTAGPWRATSSGSYLLREHPVRLMSQVAYADRRHVRELVLGDSYVSTGPLGGSTLLGGFGIFRNFALDPYFVRVPRLGYRGSVMAPSTVDVYVNDVLVRRASLAPGEFDLRGVAPAAGAGNVRYVVRDPLSRQTDVVLDYYAASTALAEGLSEYSYAAGFEREHYGVQNAGYGRPLLLGYYRLGLGAGLTSGFRAELGRTRASGGSGLTLAGRAGELELASAVSVDTSGSVERGSAGLLAYGYQSGRVSLRATVKGTTRRYATTSLAPQSDRNLIEHATSVGLSLGRATNVAAQLGLALARDAGPNARASLVLNRRLLNDVYLQVIAARSDGNQGATRYEAFATLTIALPDNHTASLSASVGSSKLESTASLSRPIMGRTGVGYQASGTLSETPRATASMLVQNRYLRADASYFFDGQSSHTLLDASGSLVWVKDGGMFLSRPIYDSFAVVEVPRTPGATVLLNNQPLGKTDESGRLFVPDLQSYYGNRLQVDTADLPSDWEVDSGEVLLAPPPHGGARVVFESHRLRAVRGRLVPRGISIDTLRYGEVHVHARGQTYISPIGAHGEIELDGLPSGEWPADAQSDTGSCVFRLPVPVEGKAIEDVGVLYCTATAGSAP